MPRDVRQRVEVTDEEDEEVRRDVMTDGDEDSARAKEPGVEDDKNEVDDEVDDEEVYEIESIIHHKFRMFGKSTGYYVKWKGYPASENSWVAEEDCNAPDLIREYFAGVDKKKGSTPKSKRPKEKDTESEERAKTKKSKKDSDKHSSTSNGRTSLRTLSKVADADTEMDLSIKAPSQTAFASMEPYFHKETWEDIIERILTVDYSQDMSNTVIYFLQLKSGEQTAASGDWMGKKAPAMTIRFYESNLRFKEESE